MNLLSPEMKIELVSGGAAIMAAIVGIIGARLQARMKKEHQMLDKQLSDLYEPLMEMYYLNGNGLSENDEKRITEMLYKNNSLAAPKLMQSWQNIISRNDTEHDYTLFCEILRSNYNWIKSRLGLPYLPDEINEKYHPNGYIETKQIASTAGILALPPLLLMLYSEVESDTMLSILSKVAAYIILAMDIYLWVLFIERLLTWFSERLIKRKTAKSVTIQNNNKQDESASDSNAGQQSHKRVNFSEKSDAGDNDHRRKHQKGSGTHSKNHRKHR